MNGLRASDTVLAVVTMRDGALVVLSAETDEPRPGDDPVAVFVLRDANLGVLMRHEYRRRRVVTDEVDRLARDFARFVDADIDKEAVQ